MPQVPPATGQIGGLDPGSAVWPGMQAAGALMWDLVDAGAGGRQLGVQGPKGAAGPVVGSARLQRGPGVGGLGLAVGGPPEGQREKHS